MNDTKLFTELERLAAAFPWQGTQLWIQRTPEGELTYVAFVDSNRSLGMDGGNSSGPTPEAAIDQVIKDAKNRDPEQMRQAKIRELEIQIAKLRMVTIGLPPYRPCLLLGVSNAIEPKPEAPAFINVETTQQPPL